jgi:hypothetical protein
MKLKIGKLRILSHHWCKPKLYDFFDDRVLDFGPFSFLWTPKPAPPILSHPWRALGYYGAGTIKSPRDMTEQEAIEWVSSFGNVAYVDPEAGFIFYRPKE